MAAHEKMLQLAKDVALPLDALMQPIALLGNRGGGKTYAGMKLFELAYAAGVQCIAIDIIGKWFGLRLGQDGKSKGLEVYIFGGKHADFPLLPEKGAFIARVIVEKRIHVVLDLSQMRKGERRRFLTDFFEEFYLLKKREDVTDACVLFLEEAHAVAPQQPQDEEKRMLGAVEDLVREGRNSGIGVVVMDQRPATVNKNCLALMEVLIALRTTFALDREVYDKWIVQHVHSAEPVDKKSISNQLPFLQAGDGFLYAPMYGLCTRLKILPKKTFDSSATAKVGVAGTRTGRLTEVDTEKVKEAMAEVVAQAEASDPAALRREVAKLKAELAKKPTEVKPSVCVEVPVLKDSEVRKFVALIERCEGFAKALDFRFKPVTIAATDLQERIGKMQALLAERLGPLPLSGRAIEKVTPRVSIATFAPLRAPKRPDQDVELAKPLPKGELAVLTAIAQHVAGVTREQLTVLTGYKTSTRNAYLQRLTERGMVRFDAHGRILANDDGVDALGPHWQPLPTGYALLEHWRKELPEGEAKVLDAVVAVYPDPCEREQLTVLTGYKTSTRNAYLQRLQARRLVADVGRGQVVAAAELFPVNFTEREWRLMLCSGAVGAVLALCCAFIALGLLLDSVNARYAITTILRRRGE